MPAAADSSGAAPMPPSWAAQPLPLPDGAATPQPDHPGQPPQQAAAYELLRRVLPAHANLFVLNLCSLARPRAPHGWFSVHVRAGRVHVEGSSGVELASGVHHFLKHWAHCSVSWDATGGVQVGAHSLSPAQLAAMEGRPPATVERAVRWSFYQNVVTMSYSMAFWEWDRWEAEVDWMALQGVNLPLMPLGMEALLAQTFVGLGLQEAQLADFFPGPAFLAWGRMGNIQGYGGPLPPAYARKQLALAKRVVARMRALGLTLVYPAFAGFVPAALRQLHPRAAMRRASNWCHFPEPFCCPLVLDPADPLFAAVGAAYITTLRGELGWEAPGTPSFYAADSFNEMQPASSDAAYLCASAASVFAGMTAADPGARWVMQAWLFYSDARFWQPPQIQALLSGVPRGRLLLLDLFAEEHPVWLRTACMHGHDFIWTMLHNFGGNLEMYGALPSVAAGVSAALAAAPGNLVGVGMAPEGVEHNPAVYEFMSEMAWRGGARAAAAPGGLEAWFAAYGARRYAAAAPLPPDVAAMLSGAWQLLARSAYSCSDGRRSTVADIPTSRPGLAPAEIVGWGLAPHLWYSVADVRAAWELLLRAAERHAALAGSSAFAYDLLDVSRELLSKLAGRFWADAVAAYSAGQAEVLRAAGDSLLALLGDMDELLGAHKGFLLGPALQRARAYAADGGRGAAGDGAAVCAARAPAASSSSSSSSGSGQQCNSLLALPPAAAAADGADSSSSSAAQLGQFYVWSLRTQLTIWGTSEAAGDSEVSDYANKEWAGLLRGFYLPRWAAWLQRLQDDLAQGRAYDAAAWRLEVLAMTYRWIATGSTQEQGAGVAEPPLLLAPQGDALVLSRQAYERYGVLLAPSRAVTDATAAAATAAAAAGLPVPPQPQPAAVVATAAAAAAAAAVVGAAAAAAAVAGPATEPQMRVPAVDEVAA